MTIVSAVEQLIHEIPAAQAVGVVDLQLGLSVAEKYNPVAAIPPDYLTVLATLASELFAGHFMSTLEQYETLRTNRKTTNLLLESQLTTTQGYHLIIRVPNKPYCLVAIVNHSVNLSTAWSSVRAGAIKVAPLL